MAALVGAAVWATLGWALVATGGWDWLVHLASGRVGRTVCVACTVTAAATGAALLVTWWNGGGPGGGPRHGL